MFNHLNLLNFKKLIDIQKARKKKAQRQKEFLNMSIYKERNFLCLPSFSTIKKRATKFQ